MMFNPREGCAALVLNRYFQRRADIAWSRQAWLPHGTLHDQVETWFGARQRVAEPHLTTPTTDTNGRRPCHTETDIQSARSQARDHAGRLDRALQASGHSRAVHSEAPGLTTTQPEPSPLRPSCIQVANQPPFGFIVARHSDSEIDNEAPRLLADGHVVTLWARKYDSGG
jgi:hypothetical protein